MSSYRDVANRIAHDDSYDADLRSSISRDEHQYIESRHHVAKGTVGELSREVDRDERPTIVAPPYGNEENDENEAFGTEGDSLADSESDDEEEHGRHHGRRRRRICYKRKITSRFTRSRHRIVRVNRHGLSRNFFASARTRPGENCQNFRQCDSSTEVSDDETSSFSHYLRRTRSRSPRGKRGNRGDRRGERRGCQSHRSPRDLGGRTFHHYEELGGRLGKHVRDFDAGFIGPSSHRDRHDSNDERLFRDEGDRPDSDDERLRPEARHRRHSRLYDEEKGERDQLHTLVTDSPMGEDPLDEHHTSGTLGTTVSAVSSSSFSNGCRSERERESDSAKTNGSSTGKSVVSSPSATLSPRLKSDTKLSKKRSVSVKNKEFGFDFGIDGWKALLQGKIKMNWTYRRQTSCIEESNEISGKTDEILQSALALQNLQNQQQAIGMSSSAEPIVVEPEG